MICFLSLVWGSLSIHVLGNAFQTSQEKFLLQTPPPSPALPHGPYPILNECWLNIDMLHTHNPDKLVHDSLYIYMFFIIEAVYLNNRFK